MKETCPLYSKINVLPCLGTDLSGCLGAGRLFETTEGKLRHAVKRHRWSRRSVLAFGTQVRGFKPSRSRCDFSGRKNPQHAFLRK